MNESRNLGYSCNEEYSLFENPLFELNWNKEQENSDLFDLIENIWSDYTDQSIYGSCNSLTNEAIAVRIFDRFERSLRRATWTAVLRPEVYPYNTIEGLDPNNLNFTKLLAVFADSWFGGSIASYIETLDSESNTYYKDADLDFYWRNYVV